MQSEYKNYLAMMSEQGEDEEDEVNDDSIIEFSKEQSKKWNKNKIRFKLLRIF